MKDVAKLKKKAAEFELKKQFDKALAIYVEILDGYDASDQEVDVSLFNRVGDLYLKQGSVGDAVDYYEQAVDRYADGGFHNNAIALCNKILRNSPGRASVYYKLGKISAQKGFKGDAKKNFLEYADRMQSSGKIDEAFRALKEFADLCPDQDDIRLMLADQLSKKGRTEEAIEQLQLLYVRYSHEGRDAEASATIARMKSIDPAAEPRELGAAPSRSAADLVFLDLDDSKPSRPLSHQTRQATHGLDLLDTEARPSRDAAIIDPLATPMAPAAAIAPPPMVELIESQAIEPAMLDGMTRADDFERAANRQTPGLLDGLETTSFASEEPSTSSPELLDFEPTSFDSMETAAIPAPAERIDDLLEFDPPSHEAPESADELLDYGEIEFEPLPLDTAVPSSRGNSPSLMGLPLLADEDGGAPDVLDAHAHVFNAHEEVLDADEDMADVREGVHDAQENVVDLHHGLMDEEEDGATIGGELELIMPETVESPIVALPPAESFDDIPLLDIDLPHPGEALASLDEAVDEAERDESTIEFADEELATFPTPPPARRQSTVIAVHDVELLRALSESDPEDNGLRRRLAEAMLESGDREGGVRELEAAMVGFERHEDLAAASKIADEIVLLNPASVKHHQKRVEYAFRTNERGRLIEAYLQLADALFRAGQMEKSRAIYQRVIDLAPDEDRAQAALESFPAPEVIPEPPAAVARVRQTGTSRVGSSAPAQAVSAITPSPTPDDEFINLGDWLRDDEAPKDTRMVVDEQEPTGDEEADFQDMLKKFKQGIAENVEEEDHQSHYDLGVAFKEMGLLDEAISEFQKALRAPANRVPTYEALGLCFIEKEQYPMAATILGRALTEPSMSESQLIGVLYLLGRCAQERGQRQLAIDYYQRVFVVDIQFQDVGDRLATVESTAS
jgi:tetratricopeptide (TPR) repeat protein